MRGQTQRPKDAENIYLKWRRIPREHFLHLVDGRDTAEFRVQFATWLSEDCMVPLVRFCFEAEPERYASQLRAHIFGKKPKLAPAQARRASEELAQRTEAYRTKYTTELLEKLRPLPCWRQIAVLNRHLKAVVPQERTRRSREASRRRRLRGTTGQPPKSIWLEQVQEDYYRQFPLPHKRVYDDLVFGQKLGEKLACKFARKAAPDEPLYLSEVAEELRCLPQRGTKPTPVWAFLSQYSICKLLLSEFARDAGRLRRTIKSLCSAYLRQLTILQADRFAERKGFLKALRSEFQRLAGGEPEFLKRVRLIHRVARYNRDIVSALRDFFFHGLDPDVIRQHRGFMYKVI
ncbi:MAG: hypothetical protein L0Z53_06245, partial [Acidobacteriales bacterium]|nr:hypothetical protein [Terriglobales bacterium]